MSSLVSPQDVLDFWIGEAATSAEAAGEKNKLWFQKSFETDREIAETFVATLAALKNGLAADWARQGPKARLAAIIVLDQFSRNIFRGHRFSFAHDAMARNLMKTGLATDQDRQLSEAERIFFYLPAEHSEDMNDQRLSVRLFEQLVRDARPEFREFCEMTRDYALRHKEVIEKYGRFPHRNAVLKRRSSRDEEDYLAQPGSGF